MFRSVIAFLFPSVPAVFHSDYPLGDSVERLRGALDSTVDEPIFRSTMTGDVSDDHVQLARAILSGGETDRVHFFGSFRETNQGVVLSGHFTMSKWPKAYELFALGFAALLAAVCVVGSVLGIVMMVLGVTRFSAEVVYGPPAGLGFLALGVGNLKLQQWFARNDIPWLSRTITAALTLPEKHPQPKPRRESWLRKRFLDLAGQ